MAGGLNLYGYANGDPVTFTDPFGLFTDSTMGNCRPIDKTRGAIGHCAVRVINEETGRDLTIELIPSSVPGTRPLGLVNTFYTYGPSDAKFAAFENAWVRVAVPDGMTPGYFDAAILAAARRASGQMGGKGYSPLAGSNSNYFVYDVVTSAGGTIPRGITSGFILVPGICGPGVPSSSCK